MRFYPLLSCVLLAALRVRSECVGEPECARWDVECETPKEKPIPGDVRLTCGNVCLDGKGTNMLITEVPESVEKIYVGGPGVDTLVAVCGPNNPQHWFYDHFWYHYLYMKEHEGTHFFVDLGRRNCMEWSRDITLATAKYLNWSISAETHTSTTKLYCTAGQFLFLKEHRVNHDGKGGGTRPRGSEEVSIEKTPLLEDISRAVLQSLGRPYRSRQTDRACHALIYTRLDCCRRQLWGAQKIAEALVHDCPSVEIVDTMPVSLKGQVDLFVNTTIAIGWAGSWVMNYLWMPPEARIIAPDVEWIYRPGPIDFGGWGHIQEWHVPCVPKGTEKSYISCKDTANPLMVATRPEKMARIDGNFSLVANEPLVDVIMDAVRSKSIPHVTSSTTSKPAHFRPDCASHPECLCYPDNLFP